MRGQFSGGLAMAPHLKILTDANGTKTMAFAAAADLAARRAKIKSATLRSRKFCEWQLTAAPLHRCWHKLAPGLGLATLDLSSALPLDRRMLRRKVDAAYDALSDDDKAAFDILDSDWQPRLPVPQNELQSAPWRHVNPHATRNGCEPTLGVVPAH